MSDLIVIIIAILVFLGMGAVGGYMLRSNNNAGILSAEEKKKIEEAKNDEKNKRDKLDAATVVAGLDNASDVADTIDNQAGRDQRIGNRVGEFLNNWFKSKKSP